MTQTQVEKKVIMIDDLNAKETRNSIDDVWGPRTPYKGKWPVRVDERTLEEPDHWVQSACVLCSNDCGMDIGVKNGKIVGVRGREVDRTNYGRLGPKGLHGWIANQSKDRLTMPLIKRNGKFEAASWDQAMSLLVEKSKEIIKNYTASAIGFYTTGQLFIEEYYTLGVIGKAGLGTPHMDGNTRLCTATAAAALMETFGSDGQPGSYTDLDVTDTILHVGHNIASQQTVLWMRILDRLAGPDPPNVIVIDPRRTETAKKATVHLAPKVGTNIPVLNGLLNQIIQSGKIDKDFIEAHTVGFDKLKETVAKWTPELVEQVAMVPAKDIIEAGEILANTKTLVSTVLQGVYQSMQATAAAVQVNNLHLIRGLIGKPGSGILQMNGQPTSQNTRECGDDGALPAFRNWDNPNHIEELAKIWNVDKRIIPHWAPPTHALQIFKYAEAGSIKMLWITCTNPAVSLPDLALVRRVLAKEDLFVVVQDAFMTETAELADLVLPAAIWGEKTGTYTNVDRTVHISHKAIEPPSGARSDFDIFLDYAKRMDFRDKDGKPLIKWSKPEEAFEAWKICTRGRPLDYTGITYDILTGGSGIQWPCNEKAPNGTERLYTDGVFNTQTEVCESYGHDLVTGAGVPKKEYQSADPQGRAFLKAADYEPPHEQPDAEYPFCMTNGRIVYHWHTRTKTARSLELNEAAPDSFIQISEADAAKYGIREGDWIQAESRRGHIEAQARIGDILPGHLFTPFHYGYWDKTNRSRAANELTLYEWDPVSKQPHFKYSAVRIKKIDGPTTENPTEPAESQPVEKSTTEKFQQDIGQAAKEVKQTVMPQSSQKPSNRIGDYIGMIDYGERKFADALTQVANFHTGEPAIYNGCNTIAGWSKELTEKIKPFTKKYSERREDEPQNLSKVLFKGPHEGGFGLVRDLQDLLLFAQENNVSWLVLKQASLGLRDGDLEAVCDFASAQTDRQIAWLLTHIKESAPQVLVVPS